MITNKKKNLQSSYETIGYKSEYLIRMAEMITYRSVKIRFIVVFTSSLTKLIKEKRALLTCILSKKACRCCWTCCHAPISTMNNSLLLW